MNEPVGDAMTGAVGTACSATRPEPRHRQVRTSRQPLALVFASVSFLP